MCYAPLVCKLACCITDTVQPVLMLCNWCLLALLALFVQRVLEETGEKLRDTTATLAAATKPKDVTIRALMHSTLHLIVAVDSCYMMPYCYLHSFLLQ
jgi:hypothetical protein